MKHIGIIGDGLMGEELFYFLLQELLSHDKIKLTWCCKSEKVNLKKDNFKKYLEKIKKRNLFLSNQIEHIQKNVIITDNFKNITDCCLIIEAINENLEKKRCLIKQLKPFLKKNTIIATNSSSIKAELLTDDKKILNKIIGLHFFYPVKLKDYVEVNIHKMNSKITINKVLEFCTKINKKVLLLKGNNRFLLNKILLKVQNHAFNLIEKFAFSYNLLDTILKEDLFYVGIFEQIDLIGIDTLYYSIKNYLHEENDIESYKSLLLTLEKMLNENKLGKKNKIGFYNYNEKEAKEDLDKNISEELKIKIKTSILKLIKENLVTYSKISENFKEILLDFINLQDKAIKSLNYY